MAHSRKQKKFKLCGHLSYGTTCARCREADRTEKGYTSEASYKNPNGIIHKPDVVEANRLRQPTHEVNSKYRQRVVSGVYNG